MPSSLLSAKIRGLRSYSSAESKAQTIEFMPLTLIVGPNGSGKTTIIESLKFIISGDEPPLSDARRNFMNANSGNVSNASVEIRFQNVKGELCDAKREIIRPLRGTTPPTVSSSYRISGKSWVHVHKQDDWCRTIPRLFNLPNHAILNYVILCHQEDNLWCMSESSRVKEIFDRIFGCEQYKKEIKHIENEIKACKSDIIMGEKELTFHKEKVARKKELISELKSSTAEVENRKRQIEALDLELNKIKKQKESVLSDIEKANANTSSLVSFKMKASDILESSEKELLQNKCDQTVLEDALSSRLQKVSRCINDTEGKRRSLLQDIRSKETLVSKLMTQQARADPMSKDLARVKELIEKLPILFNQSVESPHTSELNQLVDEALLILNRLVAQYGQTNLTDISAEIETEKTSIQEINSQLELIKIEEKQFVEQKTKIECDYTKVRSATKDAHNRVMYLKNARLRLSTGRQDDKSTSRSIRVSSIESDLEHLDNLIKNSNIQNHVARELAEVKEKLSSLKEELERDVHLPELESKLSEIQDKELKLRDERSMMIGSNRQLEQELHRKEAELKTHANTLSKYAECLGKIACNKIIQTDLESLSICFQHSITTFHNQMIVKINEVLKSRWRLIYQGSDIEYIELVDEEIKKSKEKRAFNYYIGMCKSGVRMKMREKSSSGQRALASIILRMTLAELFVKDLAFIALDEPTANLDTRNAESLAKAIGIYVKRRLKSGLNLQWIIITHNDQFLRILNAECSPYYYRINLDNENCSAISKVSFQDLQLHDDPTE